MFSKLVRKVNLSERKLKKQASFEEQKGIFGKTFILVLSSAVFRLQNCLRFLLSCFVQEIKGIYLSSLGNEVDFRDILNVSPNILAKN